MSRILIQNLPPNHTGIFNRFQACFNEHSRRVTFQKRGAPLQYETKNSILRRISRLRGEKVEKATPKSMFRRICNGTWKLKRESLNEKAIIARFGGQLSIFPESGPRKGRVPRIARRRSKHRHSLGAIHTVLLPNLSGRIARSSFRSGRCQG